MAADRARVLGHDSSLWSRWRRRALTLPGYAVATFVAFGLAPVFLPLMALFDVVRGARWASTRAALGVMLYLGAELGGVLASLLTWLASRAGSERWLEQHYRLQRVWARVLLLGLTRLFSIELNVRASAPGGASVCLVRHASLVDTLLPVVLLGDRYGCRPRYVLKRELLADPCLDLVGQRVPNAFLSRRAERAGEDAAAIAELARDLGPKDTLVLYPEGTFFTPSKLEKRLGEIGEARAARMRGLRHCLPPRPRGAHSAFAQAPEAGAIIIAHRGLPPLRSLRGLFDGALIGLHLDIVIEHVPAREVPRELDAFTDWLDARWLALDAWVESGGKLDVGAPRT